jgi:hypothetical protein
MKSVAICVVLLLIAASTADGQHIPKPAIPSGSGVENPHFAGSGLLASSLSPPQAPRWRAALVGAGAGVLLSGAFLYANCGVIFCNEVVLIAIPLAAVTGGVFSLAITFP